MAITELVQKTDEDKSVSQPPNIPSLHESLLGLHLLLAEVAYFTDDIRGPIGLSSSGVFAQRATRIKDRIPEWISRFDELAKAIEKPAST